MEIRFELGDNDDGELRSLYAWLLEDRDLRQRIRVEPVFGQAASGHMAGGLEAVVAVVAGASAVAQLGISVAAWREARRPRQVIVIVLSDEDRAAAKPVLDALQPKEDAN